MKCGGGGEDDIGSLYNISREDLTEKIIVLD